MSSVSRVEPGGVVLSVQQAGLVDEPAVRGQVALVVEGQARSGRAAGGDVDPGHAVATGRSRQSAHAGAAPAGCTRRSRRAPIPGRSHSSPVSAGTTVVSSGQQTHPTVEPKPPGHRPRGGAGERDPVLDVVLLEHPGGAEAHEVGLVGELLEALRRILVDGEPREHLGLVPRDRLPLADRDERQHVVGLRHPRPVVDEAEVRVHRRGRDHEPVLADDPLCSVDHRSPIRSTISAG